MSEETMWKSIKEQQYPEEEFVMIRDENTGFEAEAEVDWHLTNHTESFENGQIVMRSQQVVTFCPVDNEVWPEGLKITHWCYSGSEAV